MKLFIAILLVVGIQSDPIIFNNTNKSLVYENPTEETWFEVDKSSVITSIYTYHWNNGKGSPPSYIEILNSRGKSMGKWKSSGMNASMDVANGNHYIKPNIHLRKGKYRVLDHSKDTWSWNQESSGQGFAIIHARRGR